MDKKRFSIVDVYKGLGMILLVVGHCTINMELDMTNFIFAFFMPLFFFSGGLVFANKNIFITVVRKFETMIIPITVYMIVNIFIQLLCYSILPVVYAEKLVGVFQIGGIWFLMALFIDCLIYSLLFSIFKKNNLLKCTFICFLLYAIGLYFSKSRIVSVNEIIIQSMVGVFFYALGVVFRPFIYKKYSYRNKIFSFILGIGMLLLCFYLEDDTTVLMYLNIYGNSFIFTIRALLGTIGTFALSCLINQCEFLELLGRNSLGILIIHFSIYLGIPYIVQLIGIDYRMLYIFPNWIVYSGVVLILSLITCLLLNRYLPIFVGKFSLQEYIKSH